MKYIRRLIITLLVCIVAFLILQPFHPASRIKSLTGSDVVGWGRHSDTQTKVYEAQVKYKTNKNLSCADSLGGVNALIKKANTTSNLTPTEEKCLEQIIKGPSSPRDDIPKMIKGIKNALVKPEPQLIKSVQYNPRKHVVGGMKISIPGGYSKYECSGSYSQLWLNPKEHREDIGCKGMYNKDMSTANVLDMPIEDPGRYGQLIIQTIAGGAIVNINIPQTVVEYKDLYGDLTINFYK